MVLSGQHPAVHAAVLVQRRTALVTEATTHVRLAHVHVRVQLGKTHGALTRILQEGGDEGLLITHVKVGETHEVGVRLANARKLLLDSLGGRGIGEGLTAVMGATRD